jgi:Flp pilus assembly protein TadD
MASRLRFLLAPLCAAALAACASVEAARLERSGAAALDRGETERAVGDLERAAEIAPAVSGIQNNLGIAYERAGRRADAERAYERAVALDCRNDAAQANLEALRGETAAAAQP